MKIKLISFILCIIYFIESAGFNCLAGITQTPKNTLRPMTLTNSLMKDLEIIKKGKAEHKIVGVAHIFDYPEKFVDSQIEGSDKIIFEMLRMPLIAKMLHRFSYIIPNLINTITKFIMGEAGCQLSHRKKLLSKNKKILILDVYWKRTPAVTIDLVAFTLLLICGVIFVAKIAIWTIGDVIWQIPISRADLINFLLYYCLPAAVVIAGIIFYVRKPCMIEMDFRNLIYATKLCYLPDLRKKQDLKTTTVVGEKHTQGIKKYLEDDEARESRWAEYANNPRLRSFVKRFFYIEETMEIQEAEGMDKLVSIGSIAELPGPKGLIAKLKQDTIEALCSSA